LENNGNGKEFYHISMKICLGNEASRQPEDRQRDTFYFALPQWGLLTYLSLPKNPQGRVPHGK